MESGVWLQQVSYVQVRGGLMETRRKAVRSGEADGDDGEARLVARLVWKS